MRKLSYFVVAAGLVAATTVALASASRTAPRVSPAGESATAYLPAGETPAADNWNWSGGDAADTGFSQLKQINSSNVMSLKVAWNGSYAAPGAATGQFQQQPICCPDNLMYVPVTAGVVSINPGDGSVAWEYAGVKYNTIRGSTTQVRPGRTVSYSPKQDYIFAGQNDGSVVALKAKTGAPVWTAQVSGAGTYGSATSSISQPFTQYFDDGADGIVLSSPNGGESPFRGHLDAYNAKTGALIWRAWDTPDPTQLPYILTWANPAEASQGGAALWGLGPAVDTQLGLVYYGTGNLYPWTGRQPGDNLWGTSLMAVDSKTGALRWYYQTLKHDIWDLDCPQAPSVMNVPIDGKMTAVVAEGCKSGQLVVLNAANGAYLPHFNFTKIQTYDPTGRGKTLNGLSTTQWIPQGAAGCIAPQDLTVAGLTKCRAITNGTLVADSAKSGVGALFTATASLFPSDYMQVSYGGPAPNPAAPGSYGANVAGQNGTDPCPTCNVVNVANNRPIVGTTMAAAHTADAYFAFGGTAAGPYNYPHKAYSPLTHDMYACARSSHSGKSNQGSFAGGSESVNNATVNGSTSDPRIFAASVEALNLTNNTFSWQYGSKFDTFGSCNAGTIATAGNLVLTGFAGRNDQTALQLFLQGIAPGGALAAFDATTGKLLWQWGALGATFRSAPITYTYKGKQYIAVYHDMPAVTALPGGAGHLASDQREQMTVFSL
jgi:putative pyrroloquinoline-quinone binding quinoprotein